MIDKKSITMEEMREMSPGSSVTIKVRKTKDLHSIRNRAYHLNALEPELGKRFSCSINAKDKEITIHAARRK